MTASTGGVWWQLMVGHQWPSTESLALLNAAAINRHSAAAAMDAFADLLHSIRTSALADQAGMTADTSRDVFQRGEDHARDLCEKSRAKKSAYESARRSTEQLQTDLGEIARQGETLIKSIQSSQAPDALKISQIIDVVVNAQTAANAKAADQGCTLYATIQSLIDAEGMGVSAREFGASNGSSLDQAWSSANRDSLQEKVTAALANSPAQNSSATSGSQNPSMTRETENSESAALIRNGTAIGFADQSSPLGADSQSYSQPSSLSLARNGATQAVDSFRHSAIPATGMSSLTDPSAGGHPTTTSEVIRNGAAPFGGAPPTSATALVSSGTTSSSGTSTVNTATAQSPMLPTSSVGGVTQEASYENLVHTFNAGSQAGTPISAGAEAASANAVHSMQTQSPVHPSGMATPPVHTAAPVFETAHAAHAPVEAAPPPTVVAAPMSAPAPVIAAPPQVAATPLPPAGPLPAYGSDLRPPSATAPVGLSATPAAPGSAPVNMSNHPSSLGQAPVARQQSVGVPHANSVSALTERAVAASSTGSVAGTVATQSMAQQRLQRLLAAVARQEPQLRWAIGDRKDGTTALTTDLASGWIPPHVQIPSGVSLLTPGLRLGSPAEMLGPTILVATYSPGQSLSVANDAEPVATSIRARQAADVDELGWELTQATKWRDGLPRLAHTLARALAADTGCLDSEIELLGQALDLVSSRTLKTYPDEVDPAIIGNWQLLATIEALIRNEKTCANYHLAWFQASALTASSRARQ